MRGRGRSSLVNVGVVVEPGMALAAIKATGKGDGKLPDEPLIRGPKVSNLHCEANKMGDAASR